MADNVKPFAPGHFEVKFLQLYGGATNIWNRMFFAFSGTMQQADADAIASTATTAWANSVAPYVNAHLTLENVLVTDLGSATGVQGGHDAPQTGVIPIAGFLPAKDCVVAHGTINRRYRGGKPRWYQSGFVQADLQDNQTWNAATIGNVEAGMYELMDAIRKFTSTDVQVSDCVSISYVNGYSWVEYTTSSGKINYRKDPVYRATPVYDVISTWLVNPTVASQRKRGTN
jgi:hypothetical protein